MKYSIVIPAYNESKRIRETILRLRVFFDDCEIIVVDDGSVDGTDMVAKDAGAIVIRHSMNCGKGSAIKTGLSHASGDIVGFIDADGSTDPQDVKKVFEYANQCDIAIGSRRVDGAVIPIEQPRYRVVSGILLRTITTHFLGLSIKDTQCGCKGMKRNIVKHLIPHLRSNGFSIDIELLYLAKKRGLSIIEIPVTWVDSGDSRVNTLFDGAKIFLDIISIRLRDISGDFQ